MYYMYIFALKLSEGNSINILYICKFWKDYHIIKFADKRSAELVGDHYSKYPTRKGIDLGPLAASKEAVPLLVSVGLSGKEIQAPLLAPVFIPRHLIHVHHHL